MQFSELYGTQLDIELGSEDRTQRFTTARRQAAINAAQNEFIERTECLIREVSISVTDSTEEYDLETLVTDYLRIAKGGPALKIVDASANERYIEGPDDFPQKNPPLLKRQSPGYRANADSTPNGWYLRRDMGRLYLGLTPPPDVPAGETWTLLVPCVVKAADMSADGDKPFKSASGTSPTAPESLSVWHQALVHFAAFILEKLRKDPMRMQTQMQLFTQYVARYIAQDRPKGGQTIQMQRNYRSGRRASNWMRRSVNAATTTD